jgi:hypothetical protein
MAQDFARQRRSTDALNEGDLTEFFANRTAIAYVKSGADRL